MVEHRVPALDPQHRLVDGPHDVRVLAGILHELSPLLRMILGARAGPILLRLIEEADETLTLRFLLDATTPEEGCVFQ